MLEFPANALKNEGQRQLRLVLQGFTRVAVAEALGKTGRQQLPGYKVTEDAVRTWAAGTRHPDPLNRHMLLICYGIPSLSWNQPPIVEPVEPPLAA